LLLLQNSQMLVGAISYSSLQKYRDRKQAATLKPVLESQLKTGFAIKIATTRKNELREDDFGCVLGLTQRPSTAKDFEKALFARFAEPLEASVKANVFLAKKAALSVRVETMAVLTSIAPLAVVWTTSLNGGDREFWLVDSTVDVTDFLKAYFVTRLAYGHMLSYAADGKYYEPLLQGRAEHGPNLSLRFARMELLSA
jgi:hypothetical protein